MAGHDHAHEEAHEVFLAYFHDFLPALRGGEGAQQVICGLRRFSSSRART